MKNVIQLRHTVSHYGASNDLFPSSITEVDEHLKHVQKLAIHLYEKSALKVRNLRDELRLAAQDTFNELMDMDPLVSLLFAEYPWKHHHERVFVCLLLDNADSDEGQSKLHEQFPEEIFRVAEDWLLQYGWRGAGYPTASEC